MDKILLNNGIEIPSLGLGTFPMNRFGLMKAVFYSIRYGYTSFDTGSAYSNEKWLGMALKFISLIGVKKKIFITTKLSNTDQRTGNVRNAFEESKRKLKVNFIDLYLMHWPNPETYLDCWKQMEELYNEGSVRAIGVCNFHQHHLEELLKIATVIPVLNQIELHPLLSQVELQIYCEKKGIKIEAYSPLARMNPRLIDNEILIEIANKYNKVVPQIILRWNLQKGRIVIPKSSSPKRLRQNINIFDFALTNNEIDDIDNLNENFRVRHNPDTADFSCL